MILCIDVGNSHIFGGVIEGDNVRLRFRYNSQLHGTSDQLGLFFKNVIRENEIDPKAIKAIAMCSVVPALDYSVSAACIKYFGIEPLVLQPGVKSGLKLAIKNPLEVGADRIANAVAAIERFPNKNLLILDFGTATTLCAITKKKEFIGGVIMPGMKTAMAALTTAAAKLSAVDIVVPQYALGKNTEENIQSGLYYSHLGGLREVKNKIITEAFSDEDPIVIGTGGFSHLFKDTGLFDVIIHDLVLHGLRLVYERNTIKASCVS